MRNRGASPEASKRTAGSLGTLVMEHAGVRISSPLDCLLEMAARGCRAGRSRSGRRQPAQTEAFHPRSAEGCGRGTGRDVVPRSPPGGPSDAQRCRLPDGEPASHADRFGGPAGARGQPHRAPRRWELVEWRFDLYFRAFKLVIEYDGEQHSESWKADTRRREEIDKLGWRIIVVHREGIYQDPRETLDRISDALRERGARRVRHTYKAEYTRYFPGRASMIAASSTPRLLVV